VGEKSEKGPVTPKGGAAARDRRVGDKARVGQGMSKRADRVSNTGVENEPSEGWVERMCRAGETGRKNTRKNTNPTKKPQARPGPGS